MLTDTTDSLFERINQILKETEYDKSTNDNNNKVRTSNKVTNRLISALETLLIKITNDQIKEMARNMVNKYLENKWKANNVLLTKILIIYSKSLLTPFYERFIKWSRVLNKKKATSIKPIKCYYSFEDSQQNQMVNKANSSKRNVNTNQTNLSISKPPSRFMNDFFNRQEQFKQSHTKSIEKVMKDNEEEFTLICTFNPRINTNPFNSNNSQELNKKNACLRLYDERITRQNKKEQKEKEILEKLKRDASYNKKKVNEKKILQLYNDHKQRKNNKRILTRQVDIERGYTYTPDISLQNSSKKMPYFSSSCQHINRGVSPLENYSESISFKTNNSYIQKYK